ncbi:hypothetical protein F5Y17DRAFT_427591 [Xylariaceae sp. FL0594]|nr:hypothetical protein F5Y17DRAFT_427591 [Xylariaceae sp. FL0594]
MVFPGRFSTGCKRCRQRKVKCDESRPTCRRCYIYGKPCPGYTDQFHFRFDRTATKQKNPSSPTTSSTTSVNNAGTSPIPNRSREESASQSPCQTSSSPSVLSSSSSSPPLLQQQHYPPQQLQHPHPQAREMVIRTNSAQPLAIAPHLDLSYDDVSLCYFVRRFVTPEEGDNLPGHLSFLPSLFNHDSNGLLELATLSVAQMAAYNQFGGEKFRIQSYQNYGRAVRTLRTVIETQDQVTDDRVLAAVLLLCMFKDVGEEGWGDAGEHASGLYYLLEKRGVEQLFTNRGFELFLLSLLKLQVHTFLHQDDKYSDPGGLVEWLSQFNPMMRAMFLMTKTMRLRHDLFRSGPGMNNNNNDSDAFSPPRGRRKEEDAPILQACFEALAEFDIWDAEAEGYWKSTFDGRNVPAALGELANRATFYDPKTACIIILIRSARLIMLLSILEYHDSLRVTNDGGDGDQPWSVGDESAWADCVPVLEHSVGLTIDDMLCCVPFALGDLTPDGRASNMPHDGAAALVIIQPLRLVTFCAYATPAQRKRSQEILLRMRSAIGLRSAVSWEEQAASGEAAPQRPGTQSLIRAMALLAARSPSPTTSTTTTQASY